MLQIRELVRTRCFYEKPDGTTGVLYHKRVVLSDGSQVKWNRRSEKWTHESSLRWSSAVATSLNLRAMSVAEDKGKQTRHKEEWYAFQNFANAMIRIMDTETFFQIIQYLKS